MPARVAMLAAVFSPTVVFISAANNVMFRNLLDVPYSPWTSVVFFGAFALSTTMAVAVFLRAVRSRAYQACARATLLVGVCVLLFDLCTLLFDASVHRFVWTVVIDEAALVVAAIVVFRAPYRALMHVFAAVGTVLLLQGVGTHGYEVWKLVRRHRMLTRRAEAHLATGRPTDSAAAAGNVYHIVLDGFQTEAFVELHDRNPTFAMQGYTFLPNFVSNYGITHYSIPNALTGDLHTTWGSWTAWRADQRVAGLMGALAIGGVQASLYPYYDEDCTPYAEVCAPALDIAPSVTGRRVGSWAAAWSGYTTIDLWFLSELPRSLRRVLNQGWAHVDDPPDPIDAIGGHTFSITAKLHRNTQGGFGFIRQNDFAAFSKVNFDRMLADEASRPGSGQYVFYHGILPHTPYVLDCDCVYMSGPQAAPVDAYTLHGRLDAYMAQAECGLRLLQRLEEQLKRLDRFDDAMIIVHGDHGAWPAVAEELLAKYPEAEDADVARWLVLPAETAPGTAAEQAWRNSHTTALRSRALLLVKFPDAVEFTIAPQPVQMLDVAPTILRHFGLPTDQLPGVPVREVAPDVPREIVHFSGRPAFPKHAPATGTLSRFVRTTGPWHYTGESPIGE